jgi:ribosome biogenesis protein MAK21
MQASMPKVADEDDLTDDDDDDVPSGLDVDDSPSDGEDMGADEEADTPSDDDALSLAEGSDNEDLLPFNGLLTYDGSDADDEEEWGGITTNEDAGQKRKRGREEAKERRKKMRSLPTFASYEDYAKMIEDGPEDNV